MPSGAYRRQDGRCLPAISGLRHRQHQVRLSVGALPVALGQTAEDKGGRPVSGLGLSSSLVLPSGRAHPCQSDRNGDAMAAWRPDTKRLVPACCVRVLPSQAPLPQCPWRRRWKMMRRLMPWLPRPSGSLSCSAPCLCLCTRAREHVSNGECLMHSPAKSTNLPALWFLCARRVAGSDWRKTLIVYQISITTGACVCCASGAAIVLRNNSRH